MTAQAWTLLLFVAVAAAGALGAFGGLWFAGVRHAWREGVRDASMRSHLHYAELRERIAAEAEKARVKAEPLYEDAEETEPFDISLQVYGDLEDGKSTASAISFALTQWLRSGAQCGGFTAANGLRIHMISRGEQGR